jgi:hypothetical protein
MSYLPELRGSLIEAAERQRKIAQRATVAVGSDHRDQRRRRGLAIFRTRSSFGWAATIASLLIGLGGAAAVGVFRAGTPVGPEVRTSANAGEGVAIPGSVRLLKLRVADPGGGPSWGLRVLRTTRGLTCLQLGRVEFATVGVLGEDGAFGNDRRFHPLSENRHIPFDCSVTDAHGDGFLNVLVRGFPASGLIGVTGAIGGCLLEDEHNSTLRLPRCPAADLRDIYYGLLGPDAVSITYLTATGAQITTATGSDGAYLVVLPHSTRACRSSRGRPCPAGGQGVTGGPQLEPGAILAVSYRDGHTCHNRQSESTGPGVDACAPVGFVPPPGQRFTAAQLATPISVKEIPAKLYCEEGQRVRPCGAHTPRGVRRLAAGQPSLLVEISFTSRVAIPDTSAYEHLLSYPHSAHCTIGAEGGPTTANIHAGERVVIQDLVPYSCPGRIHGSVSYRPAGGPGGPLSPGLPAKAGSIPVGRFSLVVP